MSEDIELQRCTESELREIIRSFLSLESRGDVELLEVIQYEGKLVIKFKHRGYYE